MNTLLNKVAVIGANGFVGRAIVKCLLDKNINVVSVFNKSRDHLYPETQIIQIDDFVKDKLNVDGLVVCVGNYSMKTSELNSLSKVLINDLFINYSDAKYLYVSSASVYGIQINNILEDSDINLLSDYASSKYESEKYISKAKDYRIIRFVYIYGDGLSNGSFIPWLCNEAISKNKINLYGDGSRKQDYIHVNDAAALCVSSFSTDSGTLLLGATGESYTNLEVAKLVAAEFKNCEIVLDSEKENGPSFVFDPTATLSKVNWKPKMEFSSGIKSFIKNEVSNLR